MTQVVCYLDIFLIEIGGVGKNCGHILVVVATGIEPATPTMSR